MFPTEISQTTQAVTKTKDCSLQSDSGGPLQRTTHIELIEHEEVDLVSTWSPHHSVLGSLVWGGTLQSTEIEMWTPTNQQNV